MNVTDRKRTLRNIARLRRAEPNPEVALVREDLEEALEGTVSRNLAAQFLGVSHTALNNWIDSGDLPVVLSRSGRKEVPIPPLLDVYEQVEEGRASGRRQLHTLEPVMVGARQQAQRMRPGRLLHAELASADRHRISELRSLAYHRAIAPRLRRPMIEEAERKLERWARQGKIDPRHAAAWREVFALPMAQLRKVIGTDDPRGRDLRQNSPLAGALSEPERRKILARIR
ncbi:MAG TPA: hypothetical protein VND98_04500 [Solirubrobacterales bacterium]|nr:hypothetical protein [Solirubrobacterales bacterium]